MHGQYDRAVVAAQQVLQVAEQNVGPDHPAVATSLENLAALYRATTHGSEARGIGAARDENSRHEEMN